MPVSFSNLNATRFPGSATSRTASLGTTPNAGDIIVVFIGRANGAGGAASFDVANASGYDLVGHEDPAGTFRQISTVLKRLSDGTETDVTVNFNQPTGSEVGDDSNQVIGTAIVSGADYASVSVVFDQENNSTQWTFPGDSLDANLHFGSSHNDEDISSLMYPAGDTQIAHSNVAFTHGGLAVSGGNTQSGTFTGTPNGTFGTISFSEDVPAVKLSLTAPADGTVHNPSTELPAINWQLDTFGPTGDFEEYEIVVNNLTCLLYTSPSPRDQRGSRMPSSA